MSKYAKLSLRKTRSENVVAEWRDPWYSACGEGQRKTRGSKSFPDQVNIARAKTAVFLLFTPSVQCFTYTDEEIIPREDSVEKNVSGQIFPSNGVYSKNIAIYV